MTMAQAKVFQQGTKSINHKNINYSKSPTNGRSSWELSKMQTCICFQQQTRTINVRHEWNCSLPSVSYCRWPFSSTISHLLSLLQSVTLLACSLDTSPCMPAVVLYCKIKNVFFIFCLFFMYYLCEKYYKSITVQYYIDDCVGWVPTLILLDLRTN